MKKTLLFLAMLLTTVNAHAQWEAPFFPTGMTWKEQIIYQGEETQYDPIEIFEIGQDTIVNGQIYKQVKCNGHPEPVWVREQDNIIWLLTRVSPQEIKLYDFNWDDQQEITTEFFQESKDGYQLLTETFQTQDVKTTYLDKSEVQYYRKSFIRTTIRGIGNVIELNRDGNFDNHFTCLLGYCLPQHILPDLIYKKVISIQRNDVEIYRSDNIEDWIENIPNAIQYVWTDYSTYSLFDLQGRPLSTPPTRGMYIQNGKKVIK